MAGAEHLIIVDAVVDGGPPGRVLRIPVHRLDGDPGPISGHQLALSETLQLARVLNELPLRVEVYGVTITDTEQTGDLVESAVERLCDELIGQLNPSPGARNEAGHGAGQAGVFLQNAT